MADKSNAAHFQVIVKGEVKYSLAIDVVQEPVDSEIIGVDETFHGGFRVRNRNSTAEYTIAIGDEPVETAALVLEEDGLQGGDVSGDVVWPDSWYFESCVGVVYVHLLVRDLGGAGGWQIAARLRVNVLPSKLGLDRYEDLLRDLKRVSASLIFDLVSKNKRNVGFKGAGISADPANIQLRRIERIWADLVVILTAILESPARAVVRSFILAAPGQGLDSRSLIQALGRGITPHTGTSRVRSWHAVESTRIYEHGLIKSVLQLLTERVAECERKAVRQARQLSLDLPVWLDPDRAPEIIATEYTPRIERLEKIAAAAGRLRAAVDAVLSNEVFRNADDVRDLVLSPVFQNVVSYNACFVAILQYLRNSLWTLDEGLEERIKRTSRLFEHWVFIQLAAAIVNLGLECVQHDGVYSIRSGNRFTLDLDKGTFFAFKRVGGGLIRIRYEPWILSKRVAQANGDGLYAPTPYAWNPDVVIEFCDGHLSDGSPRVSYAVIVDAKYSSRISEHHWTRVNKYSRIRATHNDRQVAMQLWLAFAGSDNARPMDECVEWGKRGDLTERIDGSFGLLPAQHLTSRDKIAVSKNAAQFIADLFTFMDEPLPR